MSVPISILVEDTDSYSDLVDLSCSLDLTRSQSSLRAEEISESPPSTNSFLLWVRLFLKRNSKPFHLCTNYDCIGSYFTGKPHWGSSQSYNLWKKGYNAKFPMPLLNNTSDVLLIAISTFFYHTMVISACSWLICAIYVCLHSIFPEYQMTPHQTWAVHPQQRRVLAFLCWERTVRGEPRCTKFSLTT